jgi:hypothetical protein
MALVTNLADTWSSPVTLAAPELWQARSGSAYLSTTASPVADDGLLLVEGQAIYFEAGVVVRYRKKPGTAQATLVREALA